MPKNEVRKAIDDLSLELKQIPKETNVLEGMLEQAKAGIERITPEAVQDLVDTLQRESDEFEVEHPRVADLINQLAIALSRLGI